MEKVRGSICLKKYPLSSYHVWYLVVVGLYQNALHQRLSEQTNMFSILTTKKKKEKARTSLRRSCFLMNSAKQAWIPSLIIKLQALKRFTMNNATLYRGTHGSIWTGLTYIRILITGCDISTRKSWKGSLKNRPWHLPWVINSWELSHS